jgi:hypothetical protein
VTTSCKDKIDKTPIAPVAAQPDTQKQTGIVLETMNAARYTYVLVDTGSKKIWAAAPQFKVKVGDEVTVPPGVPMMNYKSKTLDRTFDVVYFVPQIAAPGTELATGLLSDNNTGRGTGKTVAPTPADIDFSGINKPEGGKSVAEIYAGKNELSEKEVVLRGKVVKFSPQIMGKNWIHLQDGTGSDGTNDIVVTTSTEVTVGDTVLVSGKVVKDKDFGYGYKYDVIIEDAKVKVE